MGRFTSLLEEHDLDKDGSDEPSEGRKWSLGAHMRKPASSSERAYLVDNRNLDSNNTTSGLRFRKSPNIEDLAMGRGKVVNWRTVIRGVPLSDPHWIRVGKYYLPKEVGGNQVIWSAWWEDEDKPVEAPRKDVNGDLTLLYQKFGKEPDPADDDKMIAAGDENNRVEARIGLVVKDKDGREGKIVEIVDTYNLRIQLKWTNSVKVHPMARWTTVWDQWLKPVEEPSPEKFLCFDTSCLEPGTGFMYEVVTDKALIRATPRMDGRLENWKARGDNVEMFDWDDTRTWRRCYDKEIGITGWMLLSHPEIGPLVWPVGIDREEAPLHPVFVACAEHDLVNLQRFSAEGLDVDLMFSDPEMCLGRKTPLMYAAERGYTEACVYLLEADADASLSLGGETAAHMSKTEELAALIEALSGQEFDDELFDKACCQLPDKVQAKVWSLYGEQAIQAAKRRREQLRGGRADEQATQDSAAKRRRAQRQAARFEAQRRATRQAAALAAKEATEKGAKWFSVEDLDEERAKLDEERKAMDALPSMEEIQEQATMNESADDCVSYRVCFKAVWIRVNPTPESDKIGMRKMGDVVWIFENDASGDWRRVKTGGKYSSEDLHEPDGFGWMMLRHPKLGDLVQRTYDDSDPMQCEIAG